MVSLLVDTESFLEAGDHARSAASSVERAVSRAVSGFAGSSHMAGSDEHGLTWARSYDQACGSLFSYAAQLQDASSALSRKLSATGYYYELTELANAGLTDVAIALPPSIAPTSCPYIPSAAGGERKFPNAGNPAFEWVAEQIANLIGDMWPDGDTGKLDAASTVWHRLADDLDDAASSLTSVTDALHGVRTPEVSAVHEQVGQVRTFAKKIATACRSVGKACSDLSGQINHVHLQTGITVGIAVGAIVATVAVGAGLTPVTFGISDAAAAGGVAAEVGAAVTTITGFIAELASSISAGVGLIAESVAGLAVSADLATSIGVTVGDISASAVLWGAAGAAENVGVTAITEPDGDLVGAAEDGFITWGAGGVIGRGITAGAEMLGRRVVIKQIFVRSVHNPDAGQIMLGKYLGGAPGNYIERAGTGSTYFSLGTEWDDIKVAQYLDDDGMFGRYNIRFLDQGIRDGKIFVFSHDPEIDTLTLHKEWEYLNNHGYRYDPVTMTSSPK